MRQLDFSNRLLIDRYYQKKFTFDFNNYFAFSGRKRAYRNKGKESTSLSRIDNLHTRGFNPLDGSPAIYMGCGPNASVVQNYLFSGMFAFLYLATKCINKHCGSEVVKDFCMKHAFPCYINDHQINEDFDVVSALKEASLAPCKAESGNYLSMLDQVIPYMKEITGEFLGKLDTCVLEDLDNRMEDLRSWVKETRDEILSFYGLCVRKEYLPEGSDYPAKYYLLDPLSWFSKRYGVYSFAELAELGLKRAPFSFGDITGFDGPVIPHYKDFDYMCEYRKSLSTEQPLEPFRKMTKEEEKENTLFNVLLNLCWQDEPYKKGDHTGLKDCWGRVLIPAEYEDCQGVGNKRFMTNDSISILVKKNGKWAFAERDNHENRLSEYVFDEANLIFQGFYVTRIDKKYGLYTQDGRQILPTTMEDIYDPTVCTRHIMFKKDGRFGILYRDGTMTRQLLDEVTINSRMYLSVRVGKDWGYLDKEGNFVKERQHAFIQSNGFRFNSMAIYKCGFPTDIDKDSMISFEDMKAYLQRKFNRLSVGMDLDGSILKGKAEIRMGISKRVLYYTLLPEGITFCVDMQKPYLLKLTDDRYHDMELSWENHMEAREALKAWLNEPNRKTGVRNWVELVYEFNVSPRNESKPLTVSYAFCKKVDVSQVPLCNFERFDFPEIEFSELAVSSTHCQKTKE